MSLTCVPVYVDACEWTRACVPACVCGQASDMADLHTLAQTCCCVFVRVCMRAQGSEWGTEAHIICLCLREARARSALGP